jgi:DNA-binding NarL/FixJ family response regulator
MTARAPIRVMIVDDNPRFRELLRSLLERDEQIAVVGEAENGETIVAITELTTPDVVLMDLSMPGVDGLEATLQLKNRFPGIEVVMLSATDDDQAIGAMLAGGASRFLHKSTPAAEIVRVLKEGSHAKLPDSAQAPTDPH